MIVILRRFSNPVLHLLPTPKPLEGSETNSEVVGPELALFPHGLDAAPASTAAVESGRWISMRSAMTSCKHFVQGTEMSTKRSNVEPGNVAKDFQAEGARAVVTKLMTGIEATFTLGSFLLNVAPMTLYLG